MSEEKGNNNEKLYSILAYIWLLFIVGLVADKDNPNVKFHVNQGIILFIFSVIVGIVAFILGFIPIIRSFIGIINLVPLAFMVLGIINVVNGKKERLPLIGNFDILK